MNARIVLEFPQVPEAKEIEQLIALAEKFNGVMVESSNALKSKQKQDDIPNRQTVSVIGAKMPSLHLGLEKFPQNLNNYIVTREHLDAIARVFEDEPSAEVLCEMLTT